MLDRIRNKRERAGVAAELARAFPGERFRGEVHDVEHHLAHLASAFLVSPFEEAVAVSVDGFGDFASAAWGVGRGQRDRGGGPRLFPALARHLLPGADAVPRLSRTTATSTR